MYCQIDESKSFSKENLSMQIFQETLSFLNYIKTYIFFTVIQQNIPNICQRNLLVLYQDRYIWIYIPIVYIIV